MSKANAIRSVRRSIKNVVYTEAEVKVREATSNDDAFTHPQLLQEIAAMTHSSPIQRNEIMLMVFRRLDDVRQWRHVYKSLCLLEFLVVSGHHSVVEFCRNNIVYVESLREYGYGAAVTYVTRNATISNRLHDRDIRQKASDLADRLLDDRWLAEARSTDRARLTSNASDRCRRRHNSSAAATLALSEEEQLNIAIERSVKDIEDMKSDPLLKLALDESVKSMQSKPITTSPKVVKTKDETLVDVADLLKSACSSQPAGADELYVPTHCTPGFEPKIGAVTPVAVDLGFFGSNATRCQQKDCPSQMTEELLVDVFGCDQAEDNNVYSEIYEIPSFGSAAAPMIASDVLPRAEVATHTNPFLNHQPQFCSSDQVFSWLPKSDPFSWITPSVGGDGRQVHGACSSSSYVPMITAASSSSATATQQRFVGSNKGHQVFSQQDQHQAALNTFDPAWQPSRRAPTDF